MVTFLKVDARTVECRVCGERMPDKPQYKSLHLCFRHAPERPQ